MNFNVLDVETANPNYSSICQLAIVKIRDGRINDELNYFINPETLFDQRNISIHGINEQTVKDSPLFTDITNELQYHLDAVPLFHHGPFDRIAVNRAFDLYKIERPNINWVDSSLLVRRVWKEFSHKGYGLKNLANHFGIEFKHHDALEDCRVTAEIVIKAVYDSGICIDDWCYEIANNSYSQPSDSARLKRKLNGNEKGPLYGENLVITGSLEMPRLKIAKMASDVGITVCTNVSKKTTLLAVGVQDHYKLNGFNKSSKHRKAEELISQGIEIEIISEKDLIELIESARR